MSSARITITQTADLKIREAAWDTTVLRDAATGAYLLLPAESADATFLAALGLSHAPIIATPVLVHSPSEEE